MKHKLKQYTQGFTLIELLIVVAIIAILAIILFVALDPLRRLQDSRDSKRAGQVAELLTAIKVDQVDNEGSYASAVSGATAGQVYMIGTCDGVSANQDATATAVTDECDVDPTVAACLDLEAGTDDLVVEGYIAGIPRSPNGNLSWSATYTTMTGYTLQRDSTGIIWLRSCETENADPIEVAR